MATWQSEGLQTGSEIMSNQAVDVFLQLELGRHVRDRVCYLRASLPKPVPEEGIGPGKKENGSKSGGLQSLPFWGCSAVQWTETSLSWGPKSWPWGGLSCLLRWVGCGISCKGTQKAASSLSSAVHIGEAHVALLWPSRCPLRWDPCPLPWMCTLAGSMLNFFLPIHISFSFCAIRL